MMNGRMDGSPRVRRRQPKTGCSRRRPLPAAPNPGCPTPQPFASDPPRTRAMTEGQPPAPVGANRPERSPTPAPATAGPRKWPAAWEPTSCRRDRRQETFLPFDQTSRWLAQTGFDHRDGLLAGVEDQEQESLAIAHWVAGRMPKVGSPCVGSAARDARNLAKGSTGELPRRPFGPERQRCPEQPAQERSGGARAAGLRRIQVQGRSRRTGLGGQQQKGPSASFQQPHFDPDALPRRSRDRITRPRNSCWGRHWCKRPQRSWSVRP